MKRLKKLFNAVARWLPIFLKYISGYVSLHFFNRELLKKEIWLISEKRGEARDNGHHLFIYIRKYHPEINAYYVITADSPDISKLQPYGNLIEHDSKEHMLYYLAAKYSINSQTCGAYPFEMIPQFFKLTSIFRKPNQKCVFLQHGIIKDAMPDKKLFYKTGILDLFISSTKREKEFIIEQYGYPEDYVPETGLCRFDMLNNPENERERTVLVMPTWRSWLQVRTGSSEEKQLFLESEYCQTYVSLLKSPKLKELLERYDFKLVFYPHYGMQKYIDCFADCKAERVVIAAKEENDVQDLLIRSSVLITDYSSVFFDFAYMGKPLLYYQFDEERYYEGHYQQGYFSYRKDGFGKVLTAQTDILAELEAILEKGCATEPEFIRRREEFFDLLDNKNCERNFKAILSLEERNG